MSQSYSDLITNVRIVDSVGSSDLIIDMQFESRVFADSYIDRLVFSLKEAALEYRFDWFSFIREPIMPFERNDSSCCYSLTLRRWYSPSNRNRLNWRPFVLQEVRTGVHPLCTWLDNLAELAQASTPRRKEFEREWGIEGKCDQRCQDETGPAFEPANDDHMNPRH